MLKFGITGGIGSGKSTVCNIFAKMGIPIFYSDIEAKKLHYNPIFKIAVIQLFGSDLYKDDVLDNKKMAKIIFSQPDKLKEFNKIVSPLIRRSFNEWSFNQTSPYVILESAILIETGFYENLDANIFVSCPFEIRISNAMDRDNATREEVLLRVKNQMLDSEKEKYCDFTINNDGQSNLEEQVLELHQKLLNHAQKF